MMGYLRASRFSVLLVATLALIIGAGGARAEKFLRGQNIAPVFEGWRRHSDGTIGMLFGYLNRNYEESIDLAIGPTNQFEPGDADRGQPTHFMTRRQRFVFEVLVPGDWDPKQRLIWTVTANGKTEKAQGWLQPEWEVDDGVIQMNVGGGSAPPNPPNSPPQITGTGDQTIPLSGSLNVSATATDDGIPKPRKTAPGAPPASAGVQVRWVYYRGPGNVTFSSERSERVYGKPVQFSTVATFSARGEYVLRAIASDGLLESWHGITVRVN